MSETTLLEQLQRAPGEARLGWHRAMRILMSVRPDEKGKIDWSSADADAGDAPVSTAEWQAWLRTEPRHAMYVFFSLIDLHIERPGIPTYGEVLAFVLDEVPSLAPKLLTRHKNPVRKRPSRTCRGHVSVAPH